MHLIYFNFLSYLDTFDYVIVGGGTAGSALAYLLSEQPKSRIMLIELGDTARPDSKVRAVTSKILKNIIVNLSVHYSIQVFNPIYSIHATISFTKRNPIQMNVSA